MYKPEIRSRGSEWRKWDLHVHVPGTRMNDQYKRLSDGSPDWDRFIRIIGESDVEVLGITDYYSLDAFFEFKQLYTSEFGHDGKVFFPNLELRLDHAVHDAGAEVNIHLLLRPDLTEEQASRLLENLKLENTDVSGHRKLSCAETKGWSKEQIKGASISLENLIEGVKQTFPVTDVNIEDAAMILVSGRDDGVYPGKNMSPRKAETIDRIDVKTHALFSRGIDSNYWLRKNRLEDDGISKPKPTFGGCDAHSFDELIKTLGKTGEDNSRKWELTWVKAEPSFEGLQQTLIEPEGRVRIQERKPDEKDPFYTIDRIEFAENSGFKNEIKFNPNLNAIIGSRSSGKSALLAHLAYAIDPEHTLKQQSRANGKAANEQLQGPANAISWADVKQVERKVVWESPEMSEGQVIYMPQNALFALGDDPEAVADHIRPLLKTSYRDIESRIQDFELSRQESIERVSEAVGELFKRNERLQELKSSLKELGDKEAVEKELDILSKNYDLAVTSAGLNDEQAAELAEAGEKIDAAQRIGVNAKNELRDWTRIEEERSVANGNSLFQVSISISPDRNRLPASLIELVDEEIERLEREAMDSLAVLAEKWQEETEKKSEGAVKEIDRLKGLHAQVLSKGSQAKAAEAIKNKIVPLNRLLEEFKNAEDSIRELKELSLKTFQKIESELRDNETQRLSLIDTFNEAKVSLAGGLVQLEEGVPNSWLEDITSLVNQRSKSEWFDDHPDSRGKRFSISRANQESAAFLKAVFAQEIKPKGGVTPQELAKKILSQMPEVRIFAIFDGDRLGGFEDTSMTPGKRALFALSLILDGESKPWPLLLDQPEDDLDSRSVFDTIVPFLKEVKKKRQVIMVSHDANLVVGSDSEEVIVANRHGSDRPNHDEKMLFDYLTGALEDSTPANQADHRVLERQGIREHCCEILDGGEEAFNKRKSKYKI